MAAYVRFSNRPVGVKRFQAIHHYSVDVAHGLVLLSGIGTLFLIQNCVVFAINERRYAGQARKNPL
jgi:cell division protein FtsX